MLQKIQQRRLGEDLKPDEEPVRLACDEKTRFPAAEVATFQALPNEVPKIEVSFFGMFGASGALPYHYTQLVIDRVRSKDTSLRDFLDIFNHRLLSMFYRAWEKNHFPISYETAHAAGREDTMTRALWALIGARSPAIRALPVIAEYQLYFAGHLSRPRPIPQALSSMLSKIFGVGARVDACRGQWIKIPPGDQSRMGSSPLGVLINNQLGVDAIAGERVWEVENRFRIQLGPVSFSRFLEFTPTGRSDDTSSKLLQVSRWIRRYVGPQFDFDIQVDVEAAEVRGVRLGDPETTRLGWTTWLGKWERPDAATDAVFREV
jgi:type VI secretion system protein ImpH